MEKAIQNKDKDILKHTTLTESDLNYLGYYHQASVELNKIKLSTDKRVDAEDGVEVERVERGRTPTRNHIVEDESNLESEQQQEDIDINDLIAENNNAGDGDGDTNQHDQDVEVQDY